MPHLHVHCGEHALCILHVQPCSSKNNISDLLYVTACARRMLCFEHWHQLHAAESTHGQALLQLQAPPAAAFSPVISSSSSLASNTDGSANTNVAVPFVPSLDRVSCTSGTDGSGTPRMNCMHERSWIIRKTTDGLNANSRLVSDPQYFNDVYS